MEEREGEAFDAVGFDPETERFLAEAQQRRKDDEIIEQKQRAIKRMQTDRKFHEEKKKLAEAGMRLPERFQGYDEGGGREIAPGVVDLGGPARGRWVPPQVRKEAYGRALQMRQAGKAIRDARRRAQYEAWRSMQPPTAWGLELEKARLRGPQFDYSKTPEGQAQYWQGMKEVAQIRAPQLGYPQTEEGQRRQLEAEREIAQIRAPQLSYRQTEEGQRRELEAEREIAAIKAPFDYTKTEEGQRRELQTAKEVARIKGEAELTKPPFTKAYILKGLGDLKTGAPTSIMGIAEPMLMSLEDHIGHATKEFGPNWYEVAPEAFEIIQAKFPNEQIIIEEGGQQYVIVGRDQDGELLVEPVGSP
jgi:hypothetical protein